MNCLRLGRGLTPDFGCSIVVVTDLETKTCTIPRRRERRNFFAQVFLRDGRQCPKAGN